MPAASKRRSRARRECCEFSEAWLEEKGKKRSNRALLVVSWGNKNTSCRGTPNNDANPRFFRAGRRRLGKPLLSRNPPLQNQSVTPCGERHGKIVCCKTGMGKESLNRGANHMITSSATPLCFVFAYFPAGFSGNHGSRIQFQLLKPIPPTLRFTSSWERSTSPGCQGSRKSCPFSSNSL